MTQRESFLGKHWSNMLFVGVLLLIIIPQTRKPIQVMLHRLVTSSPTEIKKEERQILKDYNWDVKTKTGDQINLSQSRGKVMLLNYLATWCAPCIAELPDLEHLYRDYKDQIDFYFLTVEDPELVTSFLEKTDSSIPVYFLTNSPPEVLQSKSLPTTFLISPNGEILMKETRASNWNSKTVRTTIDKLK